MSEHPDPETARRFLAEIEGSLGGLGDPSPTSLSIGGTGSLAGVFATTDLAVASVAAAGRAAARVVRASGGRSRRIDVDRRPASMWFRSTIDPIGWDIPSPWDSVAAGGCAAALRSEEEWQRHPQGVAVASEPLIDVERLNGVAQSNIRLR